MSLPGSLAPFAVPNVFRIGNPFARLVAWALPPGRRESRVVGLAAAGIVLFIAAFTIIMLREIEDVGRTSSEKHIQQLAKTVTDQLGTTLYMADQAMRYASDQIGMYDDPGKLSELGDAGQMPVNRLLDFFFVDLKGRVITSAITSDESRKGLDVSDRDYFRFHIGSTSLDTRISRPIVSRVNGAKLIPVSRVVRRPNGEAMGVMVAIISVSDLERIWRDIGLKSEDALQLLDADGRMLLRWPDDADAHAPAHDRIEWSRRVSGWPLQVMGAVGREVVQMETAPVRQVLLLSACVGGFLVAGFGLTLANRTRQVIRERATAAKARDLLQETLDALPAGVALYDSEDRLQLCNSVAASISPVLGRPGAIGRTYESLILETRKEREAEGFADQDDWVTNEIKRFRNKGQRGLRPLADGRWIEMYEELTPSGGTVGLRIDITESKNQEIEAQRARDLADATQARMVAAIDAVPVEFIEFDHNRRMILANRAARDSQGWNGQPLGTTLREMMSEATVPFRLAHPDQDWDAWIEQRMASFAHSGTVDLPRPGGTYGRFYINDMPGGGRVIVRVDITEMKQREAKLAAEMERLNSLIESSRSLILMLDAEGRVVVANQLMIEALGKGGETVEGQQFKDLVFSGFDVPTIAKWATDLELLRTAASGGPLALDDVECSRLGGDGEKHLFRLTTNPVQGGDGKLRYIVVMAIDDTERRNAEIRLFDASRLSNLGEMATGIAHEINQPLAVIRLATESLREELDMPEAASIEPGMVEFVKQKLDRITNQTERASGIVRDLRTIARKPANTPRPFDLAEASRVAGELLSQQLKMARVDFTLDLATPGPTVLGEASRLQQVMINLVLNARDALIDRPDLPTLGTLGHIALRVAAASDGNAVLIVEDDGPGIPAHVLPRLFEPFFTTKPTGKGTGLGLSISYNIVKGMGGEITAGNRPEGGARFRLCLPAVPVP